MNSSYLYDQSGRIDVWKHPYGGYYYKYNYDTASNLISVDSVSLGLESWRASYGLPLDGSGVGADEVSATDDGVPNLLKYKLGLNPTITYDSDIPEVILVESGGLTYLAVQYSIPVNSPPELTFIIEVSDDGIIWNSGPSFTTEVSNSEASGFYHVVVRDLIPISDITANYRLIRLRLNWSDFL